MRGADTFAEGLFTLRQLEDFISAGHPQRAIRQMVNAALMQMDALFCGMYKPTSRAVAPASPLRS